MRTANDWFNEYSKTHQNTLNQKIHYVCVPAIFWSATALLSSIPVPASFPSWLDWPIIALVPVLGFYASLGLKYFFIMLAVSLFSIASIKVLSMAGISSFVLGLTVFIIAWIGQFYGHKVEGQKPSFFTDLLFLLIGPLWVAEKALRKKGSLS